MKTFFLFLLIILFSITNTYADVTNKIINNLEKTTNYSFKFIQEINNKKESGNCVLVFDRKLNCRYDNSGKILISDGKNLIIKNKNSDFPNYYKLKNTSFYKLLDKNYLINRLKSGDVKNKKEKMFIELDYQNIDIKVFFDNKKLFLKGWETTDIYSNSVLTEISIIEINKNVSEDIFDLKNFN
tara:strand:+ start:1331 stop:1882 length:552 start_codon:yes stop_codon:yes gene_type:complete